MFGALKLHGPVITSVDENNELNGAQKNPYSWGRKHNMVYIDNPVGAGHLHATEAATVSKLSILGGGSTQSHIVYTVDMG